MESSMICSLVMVFHLDGRNEMSEELTSEEQGMVLKKVMDMLSKARHRQALKNADVAASRARAKAMAQERRKRGGYSSGKFGGNNDVARQEKQTEKLQVQYRSQRKFAVALKKTADALVELFLQDSEGIDHRNLRLERGITVKCDECGKHHDVPVNYVSVIDNEQDEEEK